MTNKLLTLLLFFVSHTVIASETNKVRVLQDSQESVYQSKFECQNVLSTNSFQDCWLILTHKNKPVKNTEIFIKGGMPEHQHGLPTSPKIEWSEDKNAYLIKGLKFSMPGQWLLNFKINADDISLKDQIAIGIKVN